jgi:murein DD-endopeptidase MepM/ murein hydrolase activator NlpD
MKKSLAALLLYGLTACTSAPPSGNIPVRMMGAGTAMPVQNNQPLYPVNNVARPLNAPVTNQVSSNYNNSPQTVSVSPYQGQGQHVTQPPQQQRARTMPVYQPPARQQIAQPVAPARPVYTPSQAMTPQAMPKPVVMARNNKTLSITDVIDATIKNAPDEKQMTYAAPVQPLEKHGVMPATPLHGSSQTATTVVKEAGHQPSKQDIAGLGRTAPHFYWPVRGNVISNFGAKGSGKQNDGINITAPKGTAVKAAATGLVVYSGQDLGGLGNLILVRHSGGFHTAYAHVDNPLVKTGDRVAVGQAIANLGKSGNVTTPQLHFEIRNGKKPVNPDNYLPRA